MPSNYFFTEPSSLDQDQAEGKAFGPVPQSLDTQYRVCSLHTASNDPKAIAINDGMVAVQRITGSMPALVNIVLKPTSQGSIDGFRVKYFIYRGILESSLIGSSSIIASSLQNDLTKSIWDSQVAHNSKTGDTGDPPEDILGLQHQSLPDTDSVDKLFYDGSTNFCRPYVFAGWHIGTFSKSEFGIQVVTENYHSDLNLGKVRQLDHIITAAAYPSSGTTKQQFENKTIREAVLSYIDPAAFYGLSYYEGVPAMNGGAKTNYKDDAIYDDLLTDAANSIIRFHNYNVLYIDFRNDKGTSRNFSESSYKYNLLNFVLSGESIESTKTFSTSQWPLLVLKDTSYTSASPVNGAIKLIFEYPISSEAYTAAFFLATGFRFDSDDLDIKPVNANKILSNFSEIRNDTGKTGLKNSIGIPYNNSSGHIGSYYLKVYSFEKLPGNIASSTNLLLAVEYLDNFFIVPKIEQTVPTGELYIQKIGHLQYIRHPSTSFEAIYEVGVAWEENRVVFFAMPISIENPEKDFNIPLSFDENLYPLGSFYELGEQWINGIKIAKHELDLLSGNVPLLRYQEELFTDYWKSSEKDMLSLAMSRTEYQGLILRINDNNYDAAIHPIFLTFDQTQATDINSVAYYDANLGFAGFVNDQISTIEVDEMTAGSTDFYSIDQYLYSSDNATTEENISITAVSELFEIQIEGALSSTLSSNGYGQLFNNLEQIEQFRQKVKNICSAAKVFKLKFGMANILSEYGKSALGVTVAPGTLGVPEDTILIDIDQTFINESNEISIVKTIIHELMHAAVDFLLFSTGSNNSHSIFATKLPDLYKYYCRYGIIDDDYTVAPERSWSHNYMSDNQRHEIVFFLKAYDNVTSTTRTGGTVYYADIFHDDKVKSYPFSIEDFYQALSWGGLQRTHLWRVLAQDDHDKIQAYIAINIIERKGLPYSAGAVPISSSYSKGDFKPSTIDQSIC